MKNDNSLKKQAEYWLSSSVRNFDTAKSLLKLGHHDSCLFFCHLSLEKILKGLILIKIKKAPPYSHNLHRLSCVAGIELEELQIERIKTIESFNIAGRYDDIKFDFYKKCTKKYTEKWFEISKEIYLWLKNKYPKN